MMIQYCSDLHLEFPENEKFLRTNPIEPIGDILILSGDIVPFVVLDKYLWFFEDLSSKFKQTYWIPGNHEYYYSDISSRTGALNEKILHNVSLVNNLCVQHDDITFIFSTLWSNISEQNQYFIQNRLSDFIVIKNQDSLFLPHDYNELHRESIDFIKSALNHSATELTVVATHHVPTFLNYPEQYKGDVLNEAFASELFELIESSNINYWIFGHHHSNINDFTIANTLLLTNQLGYIRNDEHQLFKTSTINVASLKL
jgi:predicted phosphohydrolase